MKAIGIDLGDKRCGIALNTLDFVFAWDALPRHQLMEELKKMVINKELDTIVIGLPYDLYGVKTKQLEKTQAFIEKVKTTFPNLEVVWIDERYSTWSAIDTLQSLGSSKAQIQSQKDSLAASVILETYIDQQKSKK